MFSGLIERKMFIGIDKYLLQEIISFVIYIEHMYKERESGHSLSIRRMYACVTLNRAIGCYFGC
jgi:hypothetical protein